MMKAFIVRRLLLGILLILGVVTVTFILTRTIPSDPAAMWVGPRATPAQIEAARKELGLDKPLAVQYLIYIKNLLKGNLGYSLTTHKPVTQELISYAPATLELVLWGTIIGVIIGLLLGIWSAARKDRWFDNICRFFSVGAVSFPTFSVAIVLQLIFYRWLGILPVGDQLSTNIKLMYDIPKITGFLTIDSLITGNFVVFKDALIHLILPAVTIATYPIGLVARMTRSTLIEILNEDYIRTARAFGLSERKILWSYALKNSLGPTVTVIALSVGYTLVNTFIVESVFVWPGIGKYISEAIVTLNYPAIMGVTIFSACAYVILNLVADIIIIALDPRIRI